MGVVYFDASVYSQGNLACLPEALNPNPGRLSSAQQRVYEVFVFIDLVYVNILSAITHAT